jgi:glycosyltransferase involved in cell wall biosynthesis
MRILLFCQLFPPLTYGGGETLFWNIAKSLVSRGHEVYVITQKVRGVSESEVRAGVHILRVGRPVEYSGALTTNAFESLAYLVGAFVAGIRVASQRRVEIIHSNTYVPAIAGQVCASILRRKHVMTVHDVYLATMPWFRAKWRTQADVGFLARTLGPFLELALLRMPATVIHTVSDSSFRDLLQMRIKTRITVVPNSIDIGDYVTEGEVPVNYHQAIYVGRLVFYKNLEVIFRAFVNVLETVSDARLIIVGDGPMRKTWESMADDLGLKDHVRFFGRIPHKDKIRLLKESAFLILPSMVEGFGIVILEAFASERAVLVSSIEALRELVSDGTDGFLADPTDEEEWANKMTTLFTDFENTRHMGETGKAKLVADFSNERVVKAMENLYECVLTQRPKTKQELLTKQIEN